MNARRQLVSSGSPFEPRVEDWQAITRVHGEVFGAIRPANTVMQVVRFIDPEWLVEFEADAILTEVTTTSGKPVAG